MVRNAALPEARTDQSADSAAATAVRRRVQERPAATKVLGLETGTGDNGHFLHHQDVQLAIECQLRQK